MRRQLHAHGRRYRVDYGVPGLRRRKADIVFTKQRLAVFIDGCYWHHCPEHCTIPKTNTEFWTAKLAGNRDRDLETTSLLEALGWRVLRFWEHESADAVVEAIERSLSTAVVDRPDTSSSGRRK